MARTRKPDPMVCPRCATGLSYVGTKSFHEGRRGWGELRPASAGQLLPPPSGGGGLGVTLLHTAAFRGDSHPAPKPGLNPARVFVSQGKRLGGPPTTN